MKITSETKKELSKHLIDYYEYLADMKADFDNVGGKCMAQGGCFAISYYDQRKELEDSGFISVNSETLYSDTEIFDLYTKAVDLTLKSIFA